MIMTLTPNHPYPVAVGGYSTSLALGPMWARRADRASDSRRSSEGVDRAGAGIGGVVGVELTFLEQGETGRLNVYMTLS